MERCPNCGAEVREGARFCTTCGHRFGEGGSEVAASATIAEPGAAEQETLADHAVAAWPATRSADEGAAPDGWSWQPAAPPATPQENVPAPDEATAAASGERSSETWAADSSGVAVEPPEAAAPAEPFPSQSEAISSESGGEPATSLERADCLLAELRQMIAASPATESRDLSGVISELEVAITPPGAMPADELASLREAIFAARERPRDLDTVVDLTGRIEGLVALVIAYDRATAAIERALDVLRESGEVGAG